jgi:hypothetical protein
MIQIAALVCAKCGSAPHSPGYHRTVDRALLARRARRDPHAPAPPHEPAITPEPAPQPPPAPDAPEPKQPKKLFGLF